MTDTEKLLHKIQGIYFFTGGMAGIFQNIFIYKFADFKSVILYELMSLLVLFVMFIFSGVFLKKFSSRTLMKSGLLVYIVVNLLLFFLREKAVFYIFILGALSGLGHGLFWPGNNLTTYVSTHATSRNEFFGKQNFWLNIGAALGPICGGFIIWLASLFQMTVSGYAGLFLIVALLNCYLFLLTAKLPNFSGILFQYSHIVNHSRSGTWKIVLLQHLFIGLFDIAYITVSGILIFLILQTEISVGVVTAVWTLVFAISSIWAGKLLQKNPRTMLLGAIFQPLGLLIFGLNQNWWGIVAVIFLVKLFTPFLNISVSKSFLDAIDESNEPWQHKYHYLIERDTVLGAGRIINYAVLLMLFDPTNQIAIAKIWILVIPVLPLVIGLLQWQQNRLQFSNNISL